MIFDARGTYLQFRLTMARITFISHNGTAETIDGEVGQSVMDAARDHGITGIEAVCGGGTACGTCHVFVEPDWLTRLPPTTLAEQELVDFLTQKQPNSRLSCQISMVPELDGLVVHLPEHQE
jgi:ferredoxin, 2Fe-2S